VWSAGARRAGGRGLRLLISGPQQFDFFDFLVLLKVV
jgi:hypothetical protein